MILFCVVVVFGFNDGEFLCSLGDVGLDLM